MVDPGKSLYKKEDLMFKKNLQTIFSLLLVAGMFFSLVQPVNAGKTEAPVTAGLQPQISYDLHHDLSAPLAELAARQPAGTVLSDVDTDLQLPKAVNAAPKSSGVDAALQNSPVTGNMPALIADFEGVNNIAGVAPPDTEGDIGYDPGTGKKYYMQWVNLHIQAWDVTDPASPVALWPAPIAGNAVWSGFGGQCENSNDGDPIVLYDEIANRWMISQFAVDGPYYNCIAISQTSDPSGAYYRYAFLYSNVNMNDYPKYGVWPDGYYMTVNQFANASSWAGAGVAVYEREQMLTGGAARQVIFDLFSVNQNFGGMLPADFEGTPPPAGTPNYFAEVDDSSYGLGTVDEMRIWQFHTDWATDTYTFGLAGLPNQVLPVTNYDLLCSGTRDCVPQPNGESLDGIGDRLMYRLAYRYLDDGTQRMVVNHSVDAGSGRAGVRWYELQTTNTTWAITQTGTYAGDTPASDTTHRWMGSIALDRMGNAALGYSMSSSTVHPSIGLVGRLASDPAGTLPQGELLAFSGTADQSGVNRWGDYSSMSIDPEDGCTFWYTTEYSTGSWDWATRIMSFKFPSCTALPTGYISGTVTDATTHAPIEGARVSAGLFGGVTGADGSYTIRLPEGTYDLTATAYAYLPDTTTGVVVVVDQTTTANFMLQAAQMHEVSGVVSDATTGGHAWPLYARITIAGYPGGEIFTDPETGEYSVMLPEGGSFDFTVNAMIDGYSTESATVVVPAADVTKDFGLLADMEACHAPGYAFVGGFKETFDTVTAPGLPAGWTTVAVTGTPVWATNAGTRYPSGYPAVSAPNVAFFNSYSVNGGKARLQYGTAFDMTAIDNDQIIFQMFHDDGFISDPEMLQPVVSTDGGTTWVAAGPAIPRIGAADAWQQHTVDLSAYAASTSLLIGFEGTSEFGNDIHIDDVVVGAAPTCAKQAGGLLMGNVFDVNTTQPIDGAKLIWPGGDVYTAPTPNDDALLDGFFYTYVPEDLTNVMATMPNYQPDTQPIFMLDDGTLWWDFNLTAGILGADPTTFSVTIPMNSTATRTLTLDNSGTSAADYEVKELNLPATVVTYDPVRDPAVRHLGPKNFNKYTLDGIAYYLFPEKSAPQFDVAGAGDLVSSFASGLTLPWGLGVNLVDSNIWVGSVGAGGGDDLDHEFTPAGVATGKTIDTSSFMGTFAADMAYDPSAGTFWQVAVGGDNCIHEIDPVTLAATGNTICPSFGTSERGLAYDPLTDTFIAGSWNDSLIKRFDRTGTILEQVDVALPVAGLAYNSSTGHLFVTNSGTSAFDINVLDVNNAYANLGGFDVAALDGGEAGLEFSCDGHLWAPNQDSGDVLEIDSGETGVCAFLDIPWLSEAPTTGSIDINATDEVTLSFDATGILPGTYEAQLKLANNTPYSVSNVPVTLIVTTPANYGTVEGVVSGLGVCDATPGTPLAGATVEVRNSANTLVTTLTTGADGHYLWTDSIANNDYTLTVAAADYIGVSDTVTLPDGASLTHNFALRLDAPCIAAAPTALETTVLLNGTDALDLVLTNNGAGSADFNLMELPVSLSLVSPLDVIVTEGFEGAAFPPTDWTVQSFNASETWKKSASFHTGAAGADVEYDAALQDQNEWLLTPEYALASGTLSVWSNGSVYWCRDTYDNCDMNVWLVVGAPGGTDDVFVGKLDDVWPANWTWAQSTFDLTALLPGEPVRIGFQYSGNDGAQIVIDDVLLDGVIGLDVPWISETPVTGSLAADGGTATVAVNFDAAGLTAGDYSAKLRVSNSVDGAIVTVPVTMHVVTNAPPVAVDDAYSMDEDTVLTQAAPGVLANDTDAESDPLTAILVTGPAHGTLTLNANGSFTYTPDPDWFGDDTFTYKANDGADSNVATVTITINDVPETRYIFLPVVFR